MIEFNFVKTESSRLGQILLPLIPVSLTGTTGKVKAFMYLDSGADISMIPFSIGKEIGLQGNQENIYELGGVIGNIPYILSEVGLRVGETEFPARIAWALMEEVPFILGRLDVFNRFVIEFREFENRILLHEL